MRPAFSVFRCLLEDRILVDSRYLAKCIDQLLRTILVRYTLHMCKVKMLLYHYAPKQWGKALPLSSLLWPS